MGKRGTRAAPTALRLLNGARPDKVNQHEPRPMDSLPVLPDDQPSDVREVWAYTLAHLDVMGIASAADRDMLLAYCWAVVNHRNASAVLSKSPILVVGIHGSLVRNPALQVQRDAAVLMRAFAQEFGLSPSARASIEVKGGDGGDEDANPFDVETVS